VVKAVAAARQQGVTVTIATGRTHSSAAPYARRLGLGDVPLITYNGALIQTAETNRVLRHAPVPLAEAIEIARYCEEKGYYVQGYVDDDFIYPWYGVSSELYSRISGLPGREVGPISVYLEAHPTDLPSKMLMVEDPPLIEAAIPELQQRLGDRILLARSYPYFLEMIDSRVSKGTSLAWLAQELGVRRDEVLAVGDSYNDLDMLEFAGVSGAIAGAPKAVQDKATVVLADGPSLGVAEAIHRFVLGGAS